MLGYIELLSIITKHSNSCNCHQVKNSSIYTTFMKPYFSSNFFLCK